jgi:hypothetical protein
MYSRWQDYILIIIIIIIIIITWCKILVFQFALKICKDLDTKKMYFCLLFCVGVKFGRSHVGIWVFEKQVLRRIFGPKRDGVAV